MHHKYFRFKHFTSPIQFSIPQKKEYGMLYTLNTPNSTLVLPTDEISHDPKYQAG